MVLPGTQTPVVLHSAVKSGGSQYPYLSELKASFHVSFVEKYLHYIHTYHVGFLSETSLRFKVCKSVHYRTIQINHQPDATVFQFIILIFIYSSTCFGRFFVHHQELNDCSGSLWFYLCIVVTGHRPQTQHYSPRYESKTRGCHCSH
jgi:hypothetical protein